MFIMFIFTYVIVIVHIFYSNKIANFDMDMIWICLFKNKNRKWVLMGHCGKGCLGLGLG